MHVPRMYPRIIIRSVPYAGIFYYVLLFRGGRIGTGAAAESSPETWLLYGSLVLTSGLVFISSCSLLIIYHHKKKSSCDEQLTKEIEVPARDPSPTAASSNIVANNAKGQKTQQKGGWKTQISTDLLDQQPAERTRRAGVIAGSPACSTPNVTYQDPASTPPPSYEKACQQKTGKIDPTNINVH